MLNTFILNQGSCQVNLVETSENIGFDFAKKQLEKENTQYPSNRYWAVIQSNGIETRFKIINGVFTQYKQFKMID